MIENKPRRLNEVVPSLAPQGYNDRKWFLIEHCLVDAKVNVQIACNHLYSIVSWPENNNEREIATDCLAICKGMLLDLKEHYATFLSYLSDTDVPERISRKEL